jgi:hypothetical protein
LKERVIFICQHLAQGQATQKNYAFVEKMTGLKLINGNKILKKDNISSGNLEEFVFSQCLILLFSAFLSSHKWFASLKTSQKD